MTQARLVVAPLAVAAVVGAALLVGEHGSAPDSPARTVPSRRIVSTDEFCRAFDTLAAAQATQLTAASPEAVAALRDAATAVGDLAAGTAMPDTARAGVDYVVAAFLGLDDDATAQDVVESDDAATLADDSHAQALAAYVGESCGPVALSEAS